MTDPAKTLGIATTAPIDPWGLRIDRGLAVVERVWPKRISGEADATVPRPDNRALIVATATLVLVGGLWAWSGQANTARMDRLEERVDGIDEGVAKMEAKLSSIERAQLKLSYATIAIADKVGATIPSD